MTKPLFAAHLSALVTARRVSRNDLARAGFPRASVQRWISGDQIPRTRDTVGRLLAFLGATNPQIDAAFAAWEQENVVLTVKRQIDGYRNGKKAHEHRPSTTSTSTFRALMTGHLERLGLTLKEIAKRNKHLNANTMSTWTREIAIPNNEYMVDCLCQALALDDQDTAAMIAAWRNEDAERQERANAERSATARNSDPVLVRDRNGVVIGRIDARGAGPVVAEIPGTYEASVFASIKEAERWIREYVPPPSDYAPKSTGITSITLGNGYRSRAAEVTAYGADRRDVA